MRWKEADGLYEINKGMNLTQEMAKAYEARSKLQAFLPCAPVIVRLRGRQFQDISPRHREGAYQNEAALRLHRALVAAADTVLDELHAQVAYVWGDQITVLLHETDPKKHIFGYGSKSLIDSVAASLATLRLHQAAQSEGVVDAKHWGLRPHFQALSFDVPSVETALALLHGYQFDNRRNVGIELFQRSNPGQSWCSGRFAMVVNEAAKQGIFWRDLPIEFRRGTYLRRWRRPEASIPERLEGETETDFFARMRAVKRPRPALAERSEHLWLHALRNVEGWLLRYEEPVEDERLNQSAEP